MQHHTNIKLIICVMLTIILFILPSVSPIENKVKKPVTDNVEIEIWGGFRFNFKVVNNNEVPIIARVNFSIRWLGTGSDNVFEPLSVEPNDTLIKSWDCGPMIHYFTTVKITAGQKTLIKHGFTILGFNVFFPNREEVY